MSEKVDFWLRYQYKVVSVRALEEGVEKGQLYGNSISMNLLKFFPLKRSEALANKMVEESVREWTKVLRKDRSWINVGWMYDNKDKFKRVEEILIFLKSTPDIVDKVVNYDKLLEISLLRPLNLWKIYCKIRRKKACFQEFIDCIGSVKFWGAVGLPCSSAWKYYAVRFDIFLKFFKEEVNGERNSKHNDDH